MGKLVHELSFKFYDNAMLRNYLQNSWSLCRMWITLCWLDKGTMNYLGFARVIDSIPSLLVLRRYLKFTTFSTASHSILCNFWIFWTYCLISLKTVLLTIVKAHLICLFSFITLCNYYFSCLQLCSYQLYNNWDLRVNLLGLIFLFCVFLKSTFYIE